MGVAKCPHSPYILVPSEMLLPEDHYHASWLSNSGRLATLLVAGAAHTSLLKKPRRPYHDPCHSLMTFWHFHSVGRPHTSPIHKEHMAEVLAYSLSGSQWFMLCIRLRTERGHRYHHIQGYPQGHPRQRGINLGLYSSDTAMATRLLYPYPSPRMYLRAH